MAITGQVKAGGIAPITEADRILRRKRQVTGPFRSDDWAKIPAQLRNAAQFSSGIENARTMAAIQKNLQKAIDTPADESYMDKSKFVSEMRQALKAEPGDSGRMTDIASQRRLELIYDVQTTMAAEFGRYQVGQEPVLLDAYPAQELLRIEDRNDKRDWERRWKEAGGKLYAGRMIARKDSDVWAKISAFGNPFPPFDFGSGMGTEDIDRIEAEELGVIGRGEQIEPDPPNFTASQEASVKDIPKDISDAFFDQYGDQIEVKNGKVRWKEGSATIPKEAKGEPIARSQVAEQKPVIEIKEPPAAPARPVSAAAPLPAAQETAAPRESNADLARKLAEQRAKNEKLRQELIKAYKGADPNAELRKQVEEKKAQLKALNEATAKIDRENTRVERSRNEQMRTPEAKPSIEDMRREIAEKQARLAELNRSTKRIDRRNDRGNR
jgi:hypothetical protein